MKLNPELEELFHKLADLTRHEQTLYFEAHPMDPETRRQLEALLAGDESSRELDNCINQQVESVLKSPGQFSENGLIGPYKLLQRIGHGGMSEVWLAERTDGFLKRPVALKLPYTGARATHFADRLFREKDILASLVHPNIARLYDAGLADGGRPFLAIEFIEGINIASYCDQHALPVRDRLELFLQVLSAVQYAHSHLVIHRDLKPSNILVTSDREIKLLDFGIAKLMIEGEALETELTQLGGRALTLSYASPEQIAGQPVTIGSDVFSLGLILFELLSGERAFVPTRNTQAALEELVLEGDPRRLSQSVSSEVHAKARSTTPKKLATQLRGDLDQIVLKALQRSPDQRYSTADAFRADIQRYLGGEAVLAQPESARYRIKKFVLRHKIPVMSAAAVFLTFVVGLTAALWEARIAREQARTSAAVQEFTEDIFRANSVEQPDPLKAQQTTARQLLDIGARKVNSQLNDAPQAKLRMLTILGSLYMNLGLEDEAVALERQRVTLAKSLHGARSPLAAEALIQLGTSMHASNAVNDRLGVLLEAKSILDARKDYDSPDRAWLCWVLAEHYQSTDIPQSLAYAKESVRIYRNFPPSQDLARAYFVLGLAYSNSGDLEQSAVAFDETIKLSKRFSGDPNSDLARFYAYRAQVENSLRKFGEAEQ
ncbi:MAG TPA: serine/threonine-protein kinase, partial [Bryobacteraceae bacterium]|nr:serine/threonine-protein kinase [Bryobacteraceae bacterium]